MSWNYRVIRNVAGKGTTHYYWYAIHEVYYDERGHIKAWTPESMAPGGESVKELGSDLRLMRLALKLPVLEERKGKLKEVRDGRE